MGASIAAFGESRLSVGLRALIYASGSIILLAWLGNRLFGRPVGYVAALLRLTVPIFAVELLDPNVGSAELFFLLLATLFVTDFAAQRRHWQAFATGLAWALACQVRETAVIGIVPLGFVMWRSSAQDRSALLAASIALPARGRACSRWSRRALR